MKSVFYVLLLACSTSTFADINEACNQATYDRSARRFCIQHVKNERIAEECGHAVRDVSAKEICFKHVYSAEVAQECGLAVTDVSAITACFKNAKYVRHIKNCGEIPSPSLQIKCFKTL